MLFKEVLPLAVMVILLASSLQGKVIASVTDNAGMALSLNKMCCRCAETLKLLRPVADSLTRNRVGLVADHIYRAFNQHCDDLSHALPYELWCRFVQATATRANRSDIPFALLDLASVECFTAFISFPQFTFPAADRAAP